MIEEYRLNTGKKTRPIVRVEDAFELLKTLWSSPEVVMEHERYRVQLALLLQLAGITGSRPEALLKITYSDVKISLLRNPSGGEQPRVVVDLTLNHTKGYLGDKDAYVWVAVWPIDWSKLTCCT